MRMIKGDALVACLAAAGAVAYASGASASAVGAPVPGGLGLQAAASPVKERVHDLHDLLLVIITAITLVVLALLAYVAMRYRADRNPTPSGTSHNTLLEVTWTVIPVLILVVIAVPSFRLLYYMDRAHEPDLTVKVTAFQWAWEYEYLDADGLKFESYMLPAEDAVAQGKKRLLDVDEELVVPVGKTIRILTASRDVIHSFFIPSLGVQKYNIPGRVLETWMRVDRPGVYYGQCNQICGVNHAFMPIVVRAVPEAEFTAWLAEARRRFAAAEAPARVAAYPTGATTTP